MPLAAVQRAGRSLRRRRAAALAVLAVLGIVTVSAVAVTRVHPPAASSVAAPPTTTSATVTPTTPPPTIVPPPALSPLRVVASGERVDAREGWTLWLTKGGKHWSGPDGYENFRSVVDGNVDTTEPGVSHQSEGDANGAFHSGLFYGTRKAGRVELTGADGRKTLATLLELPGRPGWGVWYAHTGPSAGNHGVALYDGSGRLLAELPGA